MSTMTEATLQQLVDRSEIADLVNRLGLVLDEGRFDEMRSLLVEDATARTPGGTAEGRDAMIAQAGRNHRPEQPIQHVITNLLVDLDGDRAAVRANLVEFTLGEVYHFGLVRTPEGWRFSRIETSPVWTSGTLVRPPAG